MQYRDFDAKLRLTAIALGCNSRKALVARFHAVNSQTHCTLDRLHKWLQGRAFPRADSLVDDWAAVVKSDRPGVWLAGCSLPEFAAEISKQLGIGLDELMRMPAFAGRGTRGAAPAAAAMPRMSGLLYLCGDYACYSAAWSPYARGKLIRGSLKIEPGQRGTLSIGYSESLLGNPVWLAAEQVAVGRMLQIMLREPGGELPTFLSLFRPRPPASVMCGVMSGVTLVAPEPEPSACRIMVLRVPSGARLTEGNRYMEASASVIMADIAALGILPGDAARAEGLIADFLLPGGNLIQIAAAEQAALTAVFDPIHLASGDA